MRLRKIKKYGNSFAIKLEPADIIDFKFVEGDNVNIDNLKKENE